MDEATQALLNYAEKLTTMPAKCDRDDIESLRRIGLSDRAINDGVQVCAYFNYINRIADAFGVVPEDWIDELGRPMA